MTRSLLVLAVLMMLATLFASGAWASGGESRGIQPFAMRG